MIYYKDEKLEIRTMEAADGSVFLEEFTAQGWHPPAGYVYLYRTVREGPFRGKGWPIIVDFSVLEKYQRKGIGSRLMDIAEQIAAGYADTVCLGVGVCREYGSAQRMYARRGYIPDGSGVWYQGRQCVQYETVCTVDDDLILYLSKALPGKEAT